MKYGLKILLEHYKAKEYWYIKYITRSIIGFVCLAILIQIFKEIGFIPAQKIFEFFDNWATILSAIIMLSLAGAAVWTIMDNRYARILDRNDRLLNEVFEWASNVAEAAISRQKRTPDEFWKTKLKYKYYKAQSKYILEVVSSPFLQNLHTFLVDVTKKLEQAIEATTQIIEHSDPSKDVVDCERELSESVEQLLIEVARIKRKIR
jgi:hypothetical protein